ncbi:MAG TPA: DUF3458 domain-containing protein, partial [Rhodanobacteraceae bacterium]|nr:DUF3458 domain-containing protein [Rhodanobacteraceae bacterium]
TGNRVTCRDWFQLSLKEGLTVYREQEFESDLASRTLRRIEDVRTLWRAQFSEDAGPLAHPVRPDRYSEINNFYTATVYDKGAEIVRMLAVLLGREGFRRGLDLYFERHDGGAVAIEDFLAALGDANGCDLSAWLGWYEQAGTPLLSVHERYDAPSRRYELTLAQRTPPTPDQPRKRALPIPVAVQLFGADGAPLLARLDGESTPTRDERVLPLEGDKATFRFVDVPEAPVVSLLRGYSAPVRLDQDVPDATLAALVRHDTDGFNRWFAADTLVRRLFARTLANGAPDPALLAEWSDGLCAALDDAAIDPALMAEMLTVADAASLMTGLQDIDPEAVHDARATIEAAMARRLAPAIEKRRASIADSGDDTAPAAQARRRLRNVCLAVLCRADSAHLPLASAEFAGARNLTDRLAALGVLVSAGARDAPAAIDAFAACYANDAIVLDKWFAVQALRAEIDTLARVEALTAHPGFRWHTPNAVYALLVTFAQRNPRAFHRADGASYRFIADAVARLDAINPQVAARLVTAFGAWRSFEPVRRALMRRELERLAARSGNSPDLADLVGRALG